MNSDSENTKYRPYMQSGKRKFIFYAYILLFGIIIGVILTNTFGPSKSNSPGQNETTDIPDQEVITQNAVLNMDYENIHSEYDNMVILASQKATSAVVSIYTSGTQYYRFRDSFWDRYYGTQQREVYAMGSGVIINKDGLIITNEHVIREVKTLKDYKIQVDLTDGRSFNAVILHDFPDKDIAILSIEGDDLPYIEFGSSSDLLPGQTVLAIGNPFGFSNDGVPTVTRGIVSATKRSIIKQEAGGNIYMKNMIQTDASINEGNSGGPLVDLHGKLIGINTAILDKGAGSIGIGFAIPSDRVKLIVESAEKTVDNDNIKSGIIIQTLTSNIAEALGYSGEGGVIISDIVPGSPGERGKFEKGDIISQVDGFDVNSVEQVRNIFRGSIPGEEYEFVVFREKENIKLDLKLTEK
ncbi:S1C family serine protease [Candidatus Latescibacterota bacterium]